MRIKIQKWGNSLALRIPKAFASQSKIREDEYVKVTLEDDKIIVEPDINNYNLNDMLGEITPKNLHKETDTGKRAGAEVW
jgi:antitoxin MazE